MAGCKLHIAIWVAMLFSFGVNAQQTIQFSQYTFNGLAINPAYAGYKEDVTLNLSSRIQWVGFTDAPKTGIVSVDGLTGNTNKNVGLGLIATYDRLGAETNSSVYANYAYRVRLDELDTRRLCFGLGLGIISYSLDGNKFVATDAGDNGIPTGNQTNVTPDLRVGAYYYSEKMYFGASVFNLFSGVNAGVIDNIQIIKQVRAFYLTGGAMLPLSESVDVKPSFMIKNDFKAPTNFDVGSYIVLGKRIWLGASYRAGIVIWNKSKLSASLDKEDAIAGLAQFYINDHCRIGYSFDYATGKLANYQSGSHEFSFSLSFPGKKQRVVSPRYF